MNSCIFCKISNHEIPAFVCYEDEDVIAFLDIRPQTRGHLQLTPKRHCRWIYDIDDIGKFFETAQRIIRAIIPELGAKFVTLATFGQEIEHAHLWIVPQYENIVEIREGNSKKNESKSELAEQLNSAIRLSFQQK